MKSTFIEIHDFSTIFFIIFFFLVFGGLNVWDFFQISKSIVQSHSVVVSHHDYCVVSHDLIWSHWPSCLAPCMCMTSLGLTADQAKFGRSVRQNLFLGTKIYYIAFVATQVSKSIIVPVSPKFYQNQILSSWFDFTNNSVSVQSFVLIYLLWQKMRQLGEILKI